MLEQTTNWWHEYKGTLPTGYMEYISVEQTAVTARLYARTVVPGILQTEDFSDALLHGVLPFAKEPTPWTKLRMRRQWNLFEREAPPEMVILLDESLLYHQIGGAQVLYEQLQHLLHMSEQPFIRLQVVPFTSPIEAELYDFGLFTQASGTQIAFVDDTFDNHKKDDPLIIAYYRTAFGVLEKLALSQAATIEKMQAVLLQLQARAAT